MSTETHYARSGELSIAWQALGDGPLDLLVVPGLISHVEAFHELPGYTQLLARLARFARVITFDKRGNGLSDRIPDAPSLPERMDDVHAVLDAARSQRCAVLGVSEGSALALKFAADAPERTVALATFGGFARMLAAPGYEPGFPPPVYDQFTSHMADAWGTGEPLCTLFGPSLAATGPGARAAAAKCERLSATPTTLRCLWRMNASIDVRDCLARIQVPVLVMHRSDDRVVPVAAGRWLAEHVPGARYVELAGNDHFPFSGDPEPVVAALAELLQAPAGTAPTIAAPPPLTPPTVPAGDLDRLLASALVDEGFELGRFRILHPLGTGGMGTVFLAEDRDLARRVAIKVLHRGDADMYRRFRREAMAVAALSHPNVVQVYELGLDAAAPYLVMELVPGGNLAALAGAPLPWPRALRLVASAARGLGAAHAVGIVHRDVKPANLLLPERTAEHVKVADFGVAKLAGAEALTREGAMVGTLGYLAPEQAAGELVDARADVWALGATLYTLLTGRRPFTGTAAEIVAATLAGDLPDPRALVPAVPAAVAALVMRLGARDRDRRPADGHAAADLLASISSP
jgi:pimeloyl-ACP methyl ester carboxylesterase